MSSVTESNLGLNYGWAYGESGWNTGMDDNLVKLGFTSRNQVKVYRQALRDITIQVGFPYDIDWPINTLDEVGV